MSEFLEAFALFGNAWITALMLGALLPFAGVVLVARQQVFLGAAVGQGATLGLAVALAAGFGGDHASGQAQGETVALAFALVAGSAVAFGALRALSARGSSIEAFNATVFLLGSTGSMLLLSNSPHGLAEVQRLQLSSLLGASPTDVLVAIAGLGATLVLAWTHGRRTLLWALDPATAGALGLRLVRYDLAVGAWLGLCMGFAIHVAGLPFAFGLSVLPVLLSRPLCGSLRAVTVSAPCVGLGAVALALVLAHWLDLPPGQVAVTLLGLAVPLAHGLGRARA